MSVINKVQARNSAGQPVGEAYDIGGSGSGGVFALQAYGTLDMAYKQMTIDRIEGKWSELVEAIENSNEITLYANDTETKAIYPFKVQYVDAGASDGEIYDVQFSTVAAIIFSGRTDTQISMGAIMVSEGSDDTIVTQSSRYKLDLLEAKNIPITDTGSYFTGNTVEAALHELGAKGDWEYLDNVVIVKDLIKMEPVSGHDDLLEGKILIPFTLNSEHGYKNADCKYTVRIDCFTHSRPYTGGETYSQLASSAYDDGEGSFYIGAAKNGEGDYDFDFSDIPFAIVDGYSFGDARFVFKKSELYAIGEDDDGNVVYDPGFALNVTVTASKIAKPINTMTVSDEYYMGAGSNLRLFKLNKNPVEVAHTNDFAGRITGNVHYDGQATETQTQRERIIAYYFSAIIPFELLRYKSYLSMEERTFFSANFLQIGGIGIEALRTDDTIPEGQIGRELTQSFTPIEWDGSSVGRDTIKAIEIGAEVEATLVKVSDEAFDLKRLMYKVTFSDGTVEEYSDADDSRLSASGDILIPEHGRTLVISARRPGWYTVGEGGALVYVPPETVGTFIWSLEGEPYITKIEPITETIKIDEKYIPFDDATKMNELTNAIAALEARVAALEGGNT